MMMSVVDLICMMTSSNGNIFHVTGPLCGEFTGHRWIPLTKASEHGALMFSLNWAWINGWVNNGEAGDLRHQRAHYDITVMELCMWSVVLGTITLRVLHQNLNLMANSLHCDSIPGCDIATNFCTCHGSRAVMSCAKFFSNRVTRVWIRAKWNLHHIWIVIKFFSWNGDHFTKAFSIHIWIIWKMA